MKLIERVNEKISKKLKALTFTQYKTLYLHSTNRRVNDNEEKESDLESQHKILKEYLTFVIESNNQHEVRYGYVDGKKFGRLQSKNSSLQRIFNGFYVMELFTI
jgi:phosphoketolase